MWQLTNHTPFAAFAAFDRDKEGRTAWLVWAKSTFLLRPGSPPLFAPRQRPVERAARHAGALLLAETDIVPLKREVDVLVAGHAFPPDRKPGRVAATIGGWTKTVFVHPPHRYGPGGDVEPAPRTNAPVPLTFANAFGGVDDTGDAPVTFAENPVGTGFARTREAAEGRALPRLSDEDALPARWGGDLRPAGFGPVPRASPRRARFAGTYDDTWRRTKAPLLPDDFDPTFWQAAEADARLPEPPPPGSSVRLEGMRPGGETLEATLPSVDFLLSTRFKGSWRETPMRLQTIALDADRGEAVLTYAGALPILAAANDVLVKESVLRLGSGRGFAVASADAPRFRGGMAA